MSAYVGEFLGTMLLVFLGNASVANVLLKNSKAEGAGWVVIAFAWGIALTLCIYGFGHISGAHFNPALTIALAIGGSFDSSLVAGYVVAQLAGAFCGGAAVYLYFLPHFNLTEDVGLKLASFSTGPAIRNTPSNFFCEAVGTFILVYGVLVIGAAEFVQGLNPIAIGCLLMGIGLSLGGTTGYALNPARDLGPRLFHALFPIKGKGSSDWGYAWIPVFAPIVGAIVAVLVRAAFVNWGFN
ncbi:MIP/aquaporin family protein [Neisseria sp. Ec49-e6-T10]|uniref:MIP/aquaporin family protein n=1 Tax=Neisseria sp. Ec49-e6-T10 TaxID=3140744 RepID=UPI003EBE0A34